MRKREKVQEVSWPLSRQIKYSNMQTQPSKLQDIIRSAIALIIGLLISFLFFAISLKFGYQIKLEVYELVITLIVAIFGYIKFRKPTTASTKIYKYLILGYGLGNLLFLIMFAAGVATLSALFS